MKNSILLSGLALALISCMETTGPDMPQPYQDTGAYKAYGLDESNLIAEMPEGAFYADVRGDYVQVVAIMDRPIDSAKCVIGLDKGVKHYTAVGVSEMANTCMARISRSTARLACKEEGATALYINGYLYLRSKDFCEKYND